MPGWYCNILVASFSEQKEGDWICLTMIPKPGDTLAVLHKSGGFPDGHGYGVHLTKYAHRCVGLCFVGLHNDSALFI